MRINIFEGSRRVVKILQLISVIIIMGYVFFTDTRVSATFVTFGPETPIYIVDDNYKCDLMHDSMKIISVKTKKENSASAFICFKAMQFANGALLVPYKLNDDKSLVFGDDRHSLNVSNYQNNRVNSFILSDRDEEIIDKKWRSSRFEFYQNGVIASLIVWFSIRLFSFCVGWVVRGFLGIPSKLDAKS